ncbi:MAG: GNAT family N-acetyltransferase [Minicystis sp.]
MISLRKVALSSPEAQALIGTLDAELSGRYPEEGSTYFRLDEDEVAPGRGVFLVAFRGDEPVACGAVRKLDAHSAELKRMYVVPAARGLGLGRQMLAALEIEAAALGVTTLLLETGTRNHEALSLYAQQGYARVPAFGEYVSSPFSVCMGKAVGAGISGA